METVVKHWNKFVDFLMAFLFQVILPVLGMLTLGLIGIILMTIVWFFWNVI